MHLSQYRIVDLTQLLSPASPTWNGSCGFCLGIKKDYDQMFRVQKFQMHAGVGTHMDAPAHCIQGGVCIEKIPVSQLVALACVVDVSHKAHADYRISIQDIADYEQQYGLIPQEALVIGYTGWSRFWNDSDRYRNVDEGGAMHFPSFSKESIEELLLREIVGIGIDTLSPDCLDESYPVHHLLLGSGKYIIENIADCSQIPPKGSLVVTLPLKALGATESPVRMIAMVPKNLIQSL